MACARALLPLTAPRHGSRLGVFLTVLALLGLAILSSWHENHPDMPDGSSAIHAPIGGHSGKPDLDHLTEHAALHAIGLPALPAAVIAIPPAVTIFLPLVTVRRTSLAPPRPLRPPQG